MAPCTLVLLRGDTRDQGETHVTLALLTRVEVQLRNAHAGLDPKDLHHQQAQRVG